MNPVSNIRQIWFQEIKEELIPQNTPKHSVKDCIREISQQVLSRFAEETPILVRKMNKLGNSFYVDPQNERVFLISGHSIRNDIGVKHLCAGGNKFGRTVQMVKKDGTVGVAFKLVNKFQKTNVSDLPMISEIPSREIEAAHRYSGQKGFATVYASFNRQVEKNIADFGYKYIEYQKQILLVEKFDGNLESLSSNYSLEDRHFIALEVAQALRKMHEDGYTHGDIDIQNILFSCNEERRVCKAALWDFGTILPATYTISDYKIIQKMPWLAHNARSQQYTPESIRHLHDSTVEWLSTDHDRKANDVYAFGLVLYWLFEQKEVQWNYRLSWLRLGNHHMFEQNWCHEVLNMQLEIAQQIENLQNIAQTPKEKILLIVLEMLHPDWKKRLTIQQVVQRLESVDKNNIKN